MKKSSKYNKIPGGLADKMAPSDFDPVQLAKGIRVEMEHTNDSKIAREIAMDHLKEDPNYYDKLATIEEEIRSFVKDFLIENWSQHLDKVMNHEYLQWNNEEPTLVTQAIFTNKQMIACQKLSHLFHKRKEPASEEVVVQKQVEDFLAVNVKDFNNLNILQTCVGKL